MKKLLLILLLLVVSFLLPVNLAHATSYINTAVPSNPSLMNGLVGWWTFDGKDTNWATGKTNDLSGQGNTGQLISMSTSTSPVVGKIGQALKFDGVNDYVQIPSSTNYNSTTSTWCAWFKTSGAHGAGTGTSGSAIISRHDASGSVNGVAIYVSTTGGITFEAKDGSANRPFSLTATTQLNQWHHVCGVTAPNGSTASLYVDGVLKTSVTAGFTWAFNSQVVRLADSTDTFWGQYNGTIDDVRIYNRTLSAGEVMRLYQLGATSYINTAVPSNPSLMNGLVGWWTMDGKDTNWATGKTNDLSGQGNTGQLISMSTSTSPVSGKIGQALKFDGTSSYVEAPFATTGSSYTWSFWSFTPSVKQMWMLSAETLSSGWGFGSFDTSGTLRAYSGDSASRWIGNVNDVQANVWQHWVVVFSGGVISNVYRNGLLLSPTSNNSGSNISAATKIRIGGLPDAWWTRWNGKLDDVRIYNRALSAGEVMRLYQLGATSYINTAVPSNPSLMNGLVGQWTFDGKDTNWATGKTNDLSGQGNTGQLISMSTSTSPAIGKIGQALKFNGVNNYVSIPDNGTILDFTNTSQYTWSAWIKYSQLSSDYQCFLSKDLPSSIKQAGFNFCFPPNTSDIEVCKSTGQSYSCTAALGLNLTSGQWVHIAITYDGSSNWGIYKNGILMGTNNLSLNSDTSASYYIGAGTGSAPAAAQIPGYYFTGSIDDVRIYNRALSAGEVMRLYQLGN